MEYLKIVSDKYHLNREAGKRDHIRLFVDQLHGQITEYYNDACKEAVNAHPCYYPADYTDLLAPPGAGLGANLKEEAGKYLDEWLWDNKKWKSGKKGRLWIQTRGFWWHTWLAKLGKHCKKQR